jgi:hypothetical protein
MRMPDPVPAIEDWSSAARMYLDAGFVLFPLFGQGVPKTGTSPKKLEDCLTDFDSYEKHRVSGGGKEFGLACGHGMIVVDLDEKPGKVKGRDSYLEVFGVDPYEAWSDGPYVVTPSGGRHYFFESQIAYPVAKGLLPGFDLLGLGQWAHCAPRPGYRWQRGGLLPEMPTELVGLLDRRVGGRGKGRGNENVNDEDMPQAHPFRALFNEHFDVEAILSRHGYQRAGERNGISRYLAPGSSTGRPGVCVFGETGVVFSHHGNDLILPGVGYDCFALYMELEEGIPRESLAAKGADWSRALEIARGLLREQGISVPEVCSVEDCLERFIYIVTGDRVADLRKPPSRCTLRLSEFRNLMANVQVPAGRSAVPIAKVWLEHPLRQDADDTAYEPTEERIIEDSARGLRFVNEFEFPQHHFTERRDKLQPFHDHLEYLIPNRADREWFLSWMAQLVQHPERRGVVPLHISTLHGTGRGWVVELIREVLGSWNCKSTKMKDLVETQFHDCLDNSIFCSIPEVREPSGKRYAINDQIRDTLSDPVLEINRKYGAKSTKRVYTSFFMSSNHWDALVLGPEDRRIQVIAGPTTLMPNEYYYRLYELLQDREFVAQVWSFLKSRDISQFNWMRSDENSARARLIAASMSPTEEALRELLDDPPAMCATNFQMEMLLNRLLPFSERDPDWGSQKQLNKLLSLRCRKHRINWNGKTHRYWQLVESEQPLDLDRVRQELEVMQKFINANKPEH